MTPLQVLMSEASRLPAILEDLDASQLMQPDNKLPLAYGAVLQIVKVVNKLTQTLQCAAASRSQWWYTSREDQLCVWFPDITTANYLTYYWAFWIICVTHIRQLRRDCPCLEVEDVWFDGHLPESQHVTDELVELSTRILQSMEFLTQDEMKLFGASSAVLPFQTAFAFLEAEGGGEAHSGILKQVLKNIADRGYRDILSRNPQNPPSQFPAG